MKFFSKVYNFQNFYPIYILLLHYGKRSVYFTVCGNVNPATGRVYIILTLSLVTLTQVEATVSFFEKNHRRDRWKHLNSHWLTETGEIKKKNSMNMVSSRK